jgi:3-hydroxyacyl-[acyl-carrier-protein] dehydratase
MSLNTTVTIPADHPSLAGHFPGAPIVPGVLLLDEMIRAVEAAADLSAGHWRIGSAKFVKPVRPGETLTLRHERLSNGSIACSVLCAGRPVASGVLVSLRSEGALDDGGPRG